MDLDLGLGRVERSDTHSSRSDETVEGVSSGGREDGSMEASTERAWILSWTGRGSGRRRGLTGSGYDSVVEREMGVMAEKRRKAGVSEQSMGEIRRWTSVEPGRRGR